MIYNTKYDTENNFLKISKTISWNFNRKYIEIYTGSTMSNLDQQ